MVSKKKSQPGIEAKACLWYVVTLFKFFEKIPDVVGVTLHQQSVGILISLFLTNTFVIDFLI